MRGVRWSAQGKLTSCQLPQLAAPREHAPVADVRPPVADGHAGHGAAHWPVWPQSAGNPKGVFHR
ncbi:hypothetical protein PCI56_00400 [Plesiomonas shigelloides subsp. oncorhynchi]|nr:hypothetical protein [Plesiomonas shigelloides]